MDTNLEQFSSQEPDKGLPCEAFTFDQALEVLADGLELPDPPVIWKWYHGLTRLVPRQRRGY